MNFPALYKGMDEFCEKQEIFSYIYNNAGTKMWKREENNPAVTQNDRNSSSTNKLFTYYFHILAFGGLLITSYFRNFSNNRIFSALKMCIACIKKKYLTHLKCFGCSKKELFTCTPSQLRDKWIQKEDKNGLKSIKTNKKATPWSSFFN